MHHLRMTQRKCPLKPSTVNIRAPICEPIVESCEKFRFFHILRNGFQAPDDPTKTRFSKYAVLLNPGTCEEGLFKFLRKELGMAHFPTMMPEFDGHITLKIFRAAELEGLLVLEKKTSGARLEPLEGNYVATYPE